MIQLKTDIILVPTDFSLTAAKAIKHAAFLAQLNKGELVLLHVQKKKEISNPLDAISELRGMISARKTARERLDMLAIQIRQEYGIGVHTLVSRGKVINEIAKVSQNFKADLIVMGTDGSESLSNLFLGSNSARLLSKTSIPVMTVRADAVKLGYNRILIPIGLSEHSRQKVSYALQLARLFHSRVYVLGLLGSHEEHHRYKLEVILSQIRKRAQMKNLSMDSRIVVSKDPSEQTLELAMELEADLIISMTDEDNRLFGLIEGPYGRRLVNEANVPVVSLSPEIREGSLETISIAGQ